LKFINTYYPHVLEREENRDVYFKLRCRKFIEMICRVNDLSTQDLPPIAPKAAGKLPHPSNGTTFDHQMELDDQLQRESRAPIIPPMPVPSPFNPGLRFGDGANGADGKDDTMDTAPDGVQLVSSATDSEQLLVDALEFGQELKAEFSDDPRPAVRKALDDTFALIAYQDARESIVGGLMEGKGRVEIAEEVNSAILGKSCFLLFVVTISLIKFSVTRQAIFRCPRKGCCSSRSSGRHAEFGRWSWRICQRKKGLPTIRRNWKRKVYACIRSHGANDATHRLEFVRGGSFLFCCWRFHTARPWSFFCTSQDITHSSNPTTSPLFRYVFYCCLPGCSGA